MINIDNLKEAIKSIPKVRDVLTFENAAKTWRTILCFFSADYFVQFESSWVERIKALDLIDSRSLGLVYFIGIYISVYFLFYEILQFVVRIFVHHRIKERIFRFREEMKQPTDWGNKKQTFEIISIISPLFSKTFLRWGLLSHHDLEQEVECDIVTKEKEYNDSMKVCYRWVVTVVHTVMVSIIIWEFYSVWLFIMVIVILLLSAIYTLGCAFFILNLDYLEALRLKLIKENKKVWNNKS